MTEQPGTPSSWERWYKVATSFVAPATFVTALLFYFGYVSSRSQYAYFGVDVDTIGLSTQDYVMRSPQPLLVPLLVLTLGGAGLLALNATIRGRIAAAIARADRTADPDASPGRHVERIRRMVRW